MNRAADNRAAAPPGPLRQVALTLTARIVVLLLGLGTQSSLAWFLGPAQRGSFAACLVFGTMLSLIFTFACGSAGVYFVASRRSGLSEAASDCLAYGAAGSLLGMGAGAALLRAPFGFFAKATPAEFTLALAVIPTMLFETTLPLLAAAVGDFAGFAFLTAGNALLLLGLTVIAVGWLGQGVAGALLATVVAGAVTSAAAWLYLRRRHGTRLVRPRAPRLLGMLRYGMRSYAGILAGQVILQAGTLALAALASTPEVGLFAVAGQLTTKVLIVPEALITVLIPKVAADGGARRDLIARCARVVALLCGGLLLGVAALSPWIVTILFSPSFAPAVPLVRILAAAVAVACVGRVFETYLAQTDRPGAASRALVAGAAVNLILPTFTVPRWGLTGAALSMGCGFGVTALVMMLAFHRASGLALRAIWTFSRSDWDAVWSELDAARRRFAPAPRR